MLDMVGVAVWGLERWDHNHHGRPRSFAETFAEKYRRVAKFGKPVIIAELGIAGGNDYRSAWLSEITRSSMTHASFPLLTSIVYCNDQEPRFWTPGFWLAGLEPERHSLRRGRSARRLLQPVGLNACQVPPRCAAASARHNCPRAA
jgi:hypothetical protein